MFKRFSLYVTCLFSFFISFSLFSQGFNNTWYFGTKAGITFTTNPPTALTDGQLITSEGCGTISNSNGDLLFYTDGRTIWNKNHGTMVNGTGLKGDASAAQSSIILPKPGSGSLFYVITVGVTQNSSGGMHFSIVDMSLNGGLGEVITKNSPINTNLVEKVTAIKHSNGVYYWIIGHDRSSAKYYAYLVDCSGINLTPVISDLTSVGGIAADTWGYIAASPDAKKIAFAAQVLGVELADFDNSTGVFSNPIQLGQLSDPSITQGNYGVSFSPNGKVLYASSITSWGLFQWDLTASNIPASKFRVGDLDGGGGSKPAYRGGALMLGPDNKIYTCETGKSSLGVIHNPNTLGAGCNLQKNAIPLGTGTCRLGLPTIIQPFLEPPVITVNPINFCEGNSATFDYNGFDVSVLDSIKWVFDDPGSGVNNSSNLISTSHLFNTGGTYNIQFIRFLNCFTDTVIKTINVDKTPVIPTSISYSPSTAICSGTTITLTANGGTNPGVSEYVWGTTSGGSDLGSTTTNKLQFPIQDTTTFYVSVSDNGTCLGGSLPTGTQVTVPKKGVLLSNEGESATCYVSGNSLVHFYHIPSGRYIGAVNPQGRTGTLTMTSYVYNSGATGSMYWCGDPSKLIYHTEYLGRRFTVKPTGTITGSNNMFVYFPYTSSEIANLYVSSIANLNPNDDVSTIGNIHATKFDGIGGANEEGDPTTNCTGGTSVVLAQDNSGNLTSLSLTPTVIGTNYYTSVSDFSEFFLHGKNNLSPLPIDLLSFSAICQESPFIQLNWSTATEENVKQFIIQQLDIENEWITVENVDANGNSSTQQNYSLQTRAFSPTSYFKLISVDFDGSTVEYPPVSVICDNSKIDWAIYPNPSSGKTYIQLFSDCEAEYNLSISDINGKIVFDTFISIYKGENLININVDNIAKGAYVVKVNNKQYAPIKLIKVE